MVKKNEKRICWNCDGEVSLHLERCPYCGVDISNPAPAHERTPYQAQEMGSPFQSAPPQEDDPYSFHPRPSPLAQENVAVSDKEWDESLEDPEEEIAHTGKRDVVALLLLLPGVVFLLFGLLLLFFSKEGTLTLHWSRNLAYFYFLGAVPLIYLGWRAIK
ncbi:MAG: hypothetical protein H7A36_03420 [Chlamydiales bacterium]|nr:hypothetical protein [Chlamydiales bacterium]